MGGRCDIACGKVEPKPWRASATQGHATAAGPEIGRAKARRGKANGSKSLCGQAIVQTVKPARILAPPTPAQPAPARAPRISVPVAAPTPVLPRPVIAAATPGVPRPAVAAPTPPVAAPPEPTATPAPPVAPLGPRFSTPIRPATPPVAPPARPVVPPGGMPSPFAPVIDLHPRRGPSVVGPCVRGNR